MTMPPAILTLLFLLTTFPTTAAGQMVRVGDPVQVSTRELHSADEADAWRSALIQRFAGDSILVQPAGGGPSTLHARGEVRFRDGSHGGRGWWIGAAVGAVFGGVTGAVSSSATRSSADSIERGLECWLVSLCDNRTRGRSATRGGSAEAVFGGIVGGAIVFGGLGWLIGRAVPRWAPLGEFEVEGHPGGITARVPAP